MHRVLIVAPAWVGDMVMAHTLVQVLHSEHAALSVTMLAPKASAALVTRMPGVDRAIEFDVMHGELGLGKRRLMGRTLAGHGFDQAIVLPNSLKSALAPWFAGIPIRTGWHGEQRFVLLNDRRRLHTEQYPLMIERFMALGLPPDAPLPTPAPNPVLRPDPVNLRKLLATHGLSMLAPVTAICPGAEFGPAKRWPEDHYVQVAHHIVGTGGQVWLLGSPKDQAVCTAIAEQVPNGVTNLAGATGLLDAVDLLSAADRVLCNDSGLMHVACALGRTVIAVFGSTSPAFTPPLSEDARVVRSGIACSPCFQRECPLGHTKCLTQLYPDRVIAMLQH